MNAIRLFQIDPNEGDVLSYQEYANEIEYELFSIVSEMYDDGERDYTALLGHLRTLALEDNITLVALEDFDYEAFFEELYYEARE